MKEFKDTLNEIKARLEVQLATINDEIAKIEEAEAEAEANKAWTPKEGEDVWIFVPASTSPIRKITYRSDKPALIHSLALGEMFKTEEEAVRMWNGQVIDHALRNHPQRVRERKLGAEYFCLRHEPATTYVFSDSMVNTVVSQRLGGLLFTSEAVVEEIIAYLGQDMLRDYVVYCGR